MTDKIVVLSACANPAEAEKIANALVEKRLAACVNLVPGVQSIYRWRGGVERSEEVVLIIKSSRELFDRLRGELLKMHSYEVPEIVALQIVDGSEGYLDWLDRELLPLERE